MKNMFSKGAHPSEFGHRQTTMLMLGLFLLVSDLSNRFPMLVCSEQNNKGNGI